MKFIALILALSLPVNCMAAHSVKMMRKLSKIELGCKKAQVQDIMGLPDDAIGTIKGVQIWKYDIKRKRTPNEKADFFLIGLLLPVIGWIVPLVIPEINTYCFYFTNDGVLIQWGKRDDWDTLSRASEIN